MTDPAPAVESAAPPRRNWLRIALALSLAVNLGVGGMVAGAILRHGVPARAECDAGLGPIADAISRRDRQGIRDSLIARYRDLGAGRLALKADYDVLLKALRADPFDVKGVDAALATIATRNADRLAGARVILAEYIAGLAPEARAALADRLEKILAKSARPRKGRASEKPDGIAPAP